MNPITQTLTAQIKPEVGHGTTVNFTLPLANSTKMEWDKSLQAQVKGTTNQ